MEGVAVNPAFWKGTRVLLTGHTGFKGSWLSLWLQRAGAEVVGYALSPITDPSLFEVTRVASGMTSIDADIRDLERVRAVFAEHRPQIVIHMAAQALVHRAYDDPVLTYTTNVVGTMNVLEAARTADELRVMVCITSDKCYQNKEWAWGYRENDRLGGRDPYSSSKACAEQVISSYRHSYFPPKKYTQHGVAVASTRAGNVIGGGDWSSDRLIPDIIRAIMANEPVKIRRPKATRPWQFVLEPLSGYLLLAENMWENGSAYSEAWNFGPNIEQIQPVSWITRTVTERWGDGASWELDSAEYPHEDTFLKLDCGLAKARLHWEPRLDLRTALEWIVEWYKAFKVNKEMRRVTEDQIVRYEHLPPD